jgi:hypothetical protein
LGVPHPGGVVTAAAFEWPPGAASEERVGRVLRGFRPREYALPVRSRPTPD